MKGNKPMKTTTSITYAAFALFAFACFALSPQARATCQDACLTNNNTRQGDDALVSLTSGIDNTAIGFEALFANTTGVENTATGHRALTFNTTGGGNTATGSWTLYFNTTGVINTATGDFALYNNTTGSLNTAAGVGALHDNEIGNRNTATGFSALGRNRTGSSNIALGFEAGIKTTGSNNVDIGNRGRTGESNTIRIGKVGDQTATFIAGISGATVANGVGVIVDTNGQLGTIVSSERFKEAVKPMEKASEAILALKPVTFRYKHDLDPVGIPQFGLVAEEVEKVNPCLVARDEQGKPYTVRYDAVNAMLLNEFLKEHRKVGKLEATVMQQQKDFQATIRQLQSALKEQAAQIQKVRAQLEVSGRTQQRVVNNQ
jgi:Chaperone of endosialidase